MVQSINFIALRDAEYLQFLSSTIDCVEENDPLILNIQPQLINLRNAFIASSDLFKLPQDSPLSKEILAVDKRRNAAILGISGIVRSYSKHFNTAYREAAKLLQRNLTLHGKKIYMMNYQEKSAIISSLTEDWEDNPTLAAASTLLHLDDWTAELKESNTAFIDLYILRTQEYGAKSTATFRQKRKEGMAAYFELIKHLKARAITNNAVDYTKVLRQIDASLEQYKTLLNGRKGAKMKPKPIVEIEVFEENNTDEE